jgi:hypothetical protein
MNSSVYVVITAYVYVIINENKGKDFYDIHIMQQDL